MEDTFDIDKIVAYLRKEILNDNKSLDDLYQWEISTKALNKLSITLTEKTNYEKTIKLKEIISEKLKKSEEEEFKELSLWIIHDWGRITKGNVENLHEIIKNCIDKRDYEFERIASTSKVAAFMHPDEFAIYDSRVVYSLNWIILSTEAGSKYFPLPSGRNSKMTAFDIEVLIRLKHISNYRPDKSNALKKEKFIANKDKELFFSKKEAYNKFLQLLKNISNELWVHEQENKLAKTEMLLFSIADKEVYDDITRRCKLDSFCCAD